MLKLFLIKLVISNLTFNQHTCWRIVQDGIGRSFDRVTAVLLLAPVLALPQTERSFRDAFLI